MEQTYGDGRGPQAFVAGQADRTFEAKVLKEFRTARDTEGENLYQFAQRAGVPEATLRYWVSRAQSSGAPQEFEDLVESPEGLLLLHRIVMAARFVLSQLAGGGIRTMCTFLDLSGLWRVVASGYGTQQADLEAMETAIGSFGQEESSRLGAGMESAEITVCLDETFHKKKPCLVGIASVSDYIFVEEHAENRRSETWKAAIEKGLEGLPFEIIQSTSDEGSSLLSLARKSGAHHSPDLFHPLQDISRATSLPLKRQIEAAERAAQQKGQTLEALLNEAEAYSAERKGPGRPRDYDARIEVADGDFEKAKAEVAAATERREKLREAARGISESYHPFDPKTGEIREAAVVQADLEKHFATIDKVADEAGLSQKCRARLDKAHRVVSQMGSTIDFVHATARKKVSALSLTPAARDAFWALLLPLFYLEQLVRKAPTAEARAGLRATIASFRARLGAADSLFAELEAATCARTYQVALWCAQLFQRSSSNVEGRNGVLDLLHHSFHRLSPRKLRALTVVHNFFSTRPDGTTAAERFFGQEHRDLFEHLLMVLPPPKRPAARRRSATA